MGQWEHEDLQVHNLKNIGTAAVILCFSLILFQTDSALAAKKRFVAIGTGGPTGVYFAAGNAICQMVHKEAAEGRKKGRKHGLRCSAPSTNGSTYNIAELAAEELDFAMAQSDWQHHAFNCSNPKVTCFKKLRSVFSIHNEPLHLIVGKDSGIKRWQDLMGKRVNIGNPGSGHRGTMEVLMAAHGMSASAFGQISELDSTAHGQALCDGTIDALVYTIGVPNAGVSLVTDGCDGRILNLNGKVERNLVKSNPYYAFAKIPRLTYRTVDQPITTFGVVATLVTSADVANNDVYELTRAVMENIDDFRQLHPAFATLAPKSMVVDGLSAPLHAGALKYYREKGWVK